jgi:hypothetical protein
VDILVWILTVVLLALVIALVSAPLRAARARKPAQPASKAALEAAREAKYGEIRDLELDFRTGKLAREDYQATDATLRMEALEILNRLQALEPGPLEPESGNDR